MTPLSRLRGRIGLAAVKRTLPARMAADPVADLPDGLHAAIAGSGSPLPDPKRGNPCVAVIAGRRVFVVDAGEGASETLNRMQIGPQHIEAVLLTHFHSDHIGGLGSLAIQRWAAAAAATPMRVLGPPGVERVVAGYNEAYAQRLGVPDRPPRRGDPPVGRGRPGGRAVRLPEGGDSGGRAGRRAHDHRVHRRPRARRAGRRLPLRLQGPQPRHQRRHRPHPVLVRASKGADLLVHDALSRELLTLAEDAARKAGLTGRAKIFADITDYHASPQEAADAAREAGVGALVLTHIVPPLPLKPLEAAFLGDTAERFPGPLWIARDGDLYSVPAGAAQSSGPGSSRAGLAG